MSHYQRLSIMLILVALLLVILFPHFAAMGQLHAQSDMPTGSVAVVRGRGALLLDNTGQQMKAALTAGMLVVLIGRSADGGLLYVDGGTDGMGWVAAGSLLTVSVDDLPVRVVGSASAAPPTSTQTVTQTVTLPTPSPNPDVLTTAAGIIARVTLTDSRLNLRVGPGTIYPIVVQAQPGSLWQIVGRTEASDWLQVADAVNDSPAWAAASYFAVISGTLNTSPVIAELPAIPSAAATPVPSPALSAQNGPSANAGTTGLSGTLVFQDRNGGTIYIYDLGMGALRSLTTGIDPAISNDGRMVAFTRDGGNAGLYVINLDGSGERLLYNEHDIIRSPKWSPDDQWIVFSRSAGYDDCLALNGGVCLPANKIYESLPPEFQTGQARNALRAVPNQREYFFALSRIGIDGQGYRDIPALNKAQAPDWNEAGITYFSSVAGIQITADDGNAHSVEVANDAILGYFQDPDWQPGGGRIVFQRQMNGQHWQIFIVNPDGTGLAALTHPVTALVDELPSSVSPAWSPDGQHIVYLSNRTSIESAGAWHLWVMNADGSDQHMLPVDVPLDYTFSAEQMVSWGP